MMNEQMKTIVGAMEKPTMGLPIDIYFKFDSGTFDIITTLTPDKNEPNVNFQVQEHFTFNHDLKLGQVIESHINVLIKRLNNQPNRTV